MSIARRILWTLLIAALASVQALAADEGCPPTPPRPLSPPVGRAESFSVSLPLRDMKVPKEPVRKSKEEGTIGPANPPVPRGVPVAPSAPSSTQEGALQGWSGINAMPGILHQWEGVTNRNSVAPPDTEGDVGPNHYMQWVNLSFAIWDKSGTLLFGPADGNILWSGFGGACQTSNDGDPIVVYDKLADRWLASQFALPNYPGGPYYEAIAISATPDPLGAWYRYCFAVSGTKMDDYPHFGVWPDGYYMTINQFAGGSTWAGGAVVVFERDKMLAGDPSASFQYFDLGAVNPNYGGFLPSHVESAWQAPPLGTPNYVVEVDDGTWIPGYSNDAIRIWEVHVDWATPANSTVGLPGFVPNAIVDTAPWSPSPCTNVTRECVPQPGTTRKLDVIGDRMMYRLSYRHLPTHDTLVFNHSVWADGANRSGVRWYEVRKTGGTWGIFQQSTFAPADGNYRWMGSAAMDHAGNLAVGYSVSSDSVYPSIRYAGRLATDPVGELTQGEAEMIAGTGSETGANRWGDYSTLSLDPSDDCTFWYTQEYIQTTGSFHWQTRIGSFKFPSCTTGPVGTLTGTVTDSATSAAIVGATVTASSGAVNLQTTTGSGGVYAFSLPADTYTVSASAWGYATATSPGAIVTGGGTTTRNLALTAVSRHTLSGVVTDALTGWPLYAKISIVGYPGGDLWTDPVAGTYSVQLPDTGAVNLAVKPWMTGYTNASDTFVMPAANLIKNYGMTADLSTCTAPGYSITQGTVLLTETFDTAVPPGLPPGWSVADVSGTSGDWLTATGSVHPSGASPHGGTNLAYFNSYSASSGNSTRLYRTTRLDLSAPPSVFVHFWLLHDTGYPSSNDRVQVQVSTDGGTIWQDVGTAVKRYDGTSGWALHSVQLTGYSGSKTDVRLGLLGISDFGNDVHLDDLSVSTAMPSCTAPPTGGLAVGNAYDANTNAALNGVTVDNGTSAATTTATADPNVDEGFYALYCSEGAQVLTASFGDYESQPRNVSVPHHSAIRQNFELGAPRLEVEPASLTEDVGVGATKDATLTLSNTGTASATFEVTEYAASIVPLVAKRLPYKRRSVVSSDPADKAPPGTAHLVESWGTGAVIPTGGRYRSAGVSRDGRYLYMFGGFDASNAVLAESWKYDSQTDAWTALAPMPTALTAMGAAVIGNYIYLVGGYTGSAHTNVFQIYSMLDNTWQATTWPNARTPMTAVWHDEVYAFGGNPGPSAETWKYTPGTGLWTGPLAPMPTATSYGAAVTVGDYIFVIGGGATGAIQRYDPNTDTWDASGPALPGVRMSAGAIWYGDSLYVSMGGGSGGNIWVPYNDTLVLNPAVWPGGSWTTQAEVVATPLVGPACDCLKGRFYFMGGTNGVSAEDTNQYLDDGKLCHFNTDLPWLSVTPASGTIPAGGTQPLTVHFDASAYSGPAVLKGQLGISHNTPYLVGAVPVTMNVMYPPVTALAGASTTAGVTPLSVSFTATAGGGAGGPYTYDWDFGDSSGHVSTQNPSHIYYVAGSYPVTLTVRDSLSVPATDSHLTISVGSLPAVTSVTPSTGSSLGGTAVTLYGAHFTGATGVSFGATAAGSFSVVNDGQITTTSPAHVAGLVDVRVTNASGSSPVVSADQFTYVDPPAVTGLVPAAGTTAGGTTVTVSGTGFTGATTVSFGGTAATFFVSSPTQITATSPAHAAGTVDVRVTGPYGTSPVVSADQFVYAAPPAVSLVSPSQGSTAGGTIVTIAGSGFSGATAVSFGGTSASSYTVNSAVQITATSPAHAAGTVDVIITTSYGSSPAVAGDHFTYVDPPSVTGLNPATGVTSGGTSVAISGSGFSGATAVSFGGTSASSYTVNSAAQITATSPAHAAGPVDVLVTGPYGTSSAVTADLFVYVPPPAVTGVTPSQGPASGGTSIAIAGSGFLGATAVSFGGTGAATFTVNAATQIVATSPAHAAGTVDILITTAYGTSPVVTGDHFTFVPPPVPTGVSPVKGSSAGGTAVSISGTGFQAGATVTFGGVAATGVSVSGGTLITATAPAHASGAVGVIVTNPDGQSGTLGGAYTYVDPPVISTAKAAGTPLVLKVTGSNFHSACTVKVNGAPVPTTQWKSATLVKGKGSTLKTMLPKGTPVQITVTNDDDGISSAPFTYTR
jgi:hypothetical protein